MALGISNAILASSQRGMCAISYVFDSVNERPPAPLLRTGLGLRNEGSDPKLDKQ